MIDTELYKALKQLVLSGNYTATQADNVPHEQAMSILDGTFTRAFFVNMKRRVVQHLARKERATWLSSNYPNVEADMETEQGKTKVTVWPDGRPDGN